MEKDNTTDQELSQMEEWEEEETSGGGWKVVLITVFVVLLLIGGAVGALYYYVYSNLQPVAAQENQLMVTIPKGASSTKIGQILEDHGLIRNAKVFRYYVRYKGVGYELQAGDYLFTPGMSMDQLLEKMIAGDVYMETVKFTIPEGLAVPQIADLLAEKGLVNRDTFLKEINEGDFNYDFIEQIPENENRTYRLEGYLFPETYEMKKSATEYEIIDRMLNQFEKVFKEEWETELEQRNLTLDQAVILASIIEREVVLDEERPIVAGVFYNRIEEGWMLQSCATVQFILGKQREVITYADLEVESPYNTYINEGLPPGPIASPGKSSLEAVVFPEDNPYFFFVTKKDGSGSHYFSKTFEEHKKNNAQSRGSW